MKQNPPYFPAYCAMHSGILSSSPHDHKQQEAGKSLLCTIMTLSELSWRVSTQQTADWSISIILISLQVDRSLRLIGRNVVSLVDGKHNQSTLYTCLHVCFLLVTCQCEPRLEKGKNNKM